MKSLINTFRAIFENKKLILRLARNDFRGRFAGSFLGRIWGFIQPLVMVFVYWFAFEKGLKAGAMNLRGAQNVPFVLFIVSGLVPWFFFNDALSQGNVALVEYSYLVKKVVFEIRILPVVKIVSNLVTHGFFIILALVLFALNGYLPDLYSLQILYYSFGMFMLCLGLSYFNAAVNVFFKDWSQVISVILQVGIWLTPVMWDYDAMAAGIPHWAAVIIKLNPMYYVVKGYREALISKLWFWESPRQTAYFWAFTALALFFGTYVFQKLKPHFADVL